MKRREEEQGDQRWKSVRIVELPYYDSCSRHCERAAHYVIGRNGAGYDPLCGPHAVKDAIAPLHKRAPTPTKRRGKTRSEPL